MRQRRFTGASDTPISYYHCISRIVNRDKIFRELEQEKFTQLIHAYATFCGVEILTFCVMGNHFHILVAVPRRPDQLPTLDDFLLRLAGVASAGHVEAMRALLTPMEAAGRAVILEPYWDRMWNISTFMKELKQRFSQWYNLRSDRKGYLWEERFRSALLDPEGNTLSTVAAYIDLNPVRAGIVADPKDYRWSGYAEAMAGKESALAGYQNLMKLLAVDPVDPMGALEAYRVILYDRGEQRGVNQPGEVPVVRLGLDPKVVAAVIAANGRLERAAFLMCRIRYFQDGAVLGGKAFVEEAYQRYRSQFAVNRKQGGRAAKYLGGSPIFVLRWLRIKPIG